MHTMLAHPMTDKSGATSIEYALIAGLVALVIIGAATNLGDNLTALFGSVAAGFDGI